METLGPETQPDMSACPADPVMRILLVGRNSSGKSSSGNTILGEKRFQVYKPKKKHECKVCDAVTQIGGKQVHVIDSPDLLDPDVDKEKCGSLKEQLLSGCSAGLSSVLLTVPLEEPVENEEEILDYIKQLFGPEVQKYIMILFTRRDELEDLDQTIEEHLEDRADLQRLVAECGGKFHCFNNRSKSDDQVKGLLQKIEGVMMENGGGILMNQMRRSSSKDIIIRFSDSTGEVSYEPQFPERKDQIRLVLLGKTGVGKSATGNTIIGRNRFQSFTSSVSQTNQCQSETTERFGKKISVIDTPGLYDTNLNERDVITEVVKCIAYASPGPHAFIIVIQVGRFTKEEKNTIQQLKEAFGDQLEKYSMILFTHKDQLEKEEKTIEQFLQNGDPDLKKLVESCGNRIFSLDNNSASFPQFKHLINKIEEMVKDNGGKHFTNEMFHETQKHILEIQKQKLNKKMRLFKQKNKNVTQTEWQKIYWSLLEESKHEAETSFIETARENCITSLAIAAGKINVTCEEKESAIKEAESRGIKHAEAVKLTIRATGKLAKQKMCNVQ